LAHKDLPSSITKHLAHEDFLTSITKRWAFKDLLTKRRFADINHCTAKKDLLPQMRVVRFSVEITAFYVIMTIFFCLISQKHVMHASEVTFFC
jgi:hypothetical protein